MSFQLSRYRNFFNSVEDLVMDEWQVENRTKRRQQSSATSEKDEAAGQVGDPCLSDGVALDPGFPGDPPSPAVTVTPSHINAQEKGPSTLQGSSDRISVSGPYPQEISVIQNSFDWSTSSFSFDHLQYDQIDNAQNNGMVWNETGPSSLITPQTNGPNPTISVPLLDGTSSTQISPQDDTEMAASFSGLFPGGIGKLSPTMFFATEQQAAPWIHQLLPKITEPDTMGDQRFQFIIEQARSQHVRLNAPTLTDFLSEDPHNILSMGIKEYIEPVRRARRTIEFLGTYWVLYLLLRVSHSPIHLPTRIQFDSWDSIGIDHNQLIDIVANQSR